MTNNPSDAAINAAIDKVWQFGLMDDDRRKLHRFLDAYLSSSTEDGGEAEIRKRQELRMSFDREFATLEERVAYTEAKSAVNSDCATLLSTTATLRARMTELEDKLSEAESEIDSLTGQLADANEEIASLQEFQNGY